MLPQGFCRLRVCRDIMHLITAVEAAITRLSCRFTNTLSSFQLQNMCEGLMRAACADAMVLLPTIQAVEACLLTTAANKFIARPAWNHLACGRKRWEIAFKSTSRDRFFQNMFGTYLAAFTLPAPGGGSLLACMDCPRDFATYEAMLREVGGMANVIDCAEMLQASGREAGDRREEGIQEDDVQDFLATRRSRLRGRGRARVRSRNATGQERREYSACTIRAVVWPIDHSSEGFNRLRALSREVLRVWTDVGWAAQLTVPTLLAMDRRGARERIFTTQVSVFDSCLLRIQDELQGLNFAA